MEVRLVTEQGVEDRPPEELAALLRRETGLVWLDIPNCDDDSARVLSEVFGFHPLAIRDCVERNRVPKVHGYGDHALIVLHAPERGQRGHVHYIELDQFIGRNYLVTVHGPINPAVDRRWPCARPGRCTRESQLGASVLDQPSSCPTPSSLRWHEIKRRSSRL